MNADVDVSGLRELDQRSGNGLEVTLLWSERTGSVFVSVEDERTDTGFHFAVNPADALEAFPLLRRTYGRGRGSARACAA